MSNSIFILFSPRLQLYEFYEFKEYLPSPLDNALANFIWLRSTAEEPKNDGKIHFDIFGMCGCARPCTLYVVRTVRIAHGRNHRKFIQMSLDFRWIER